MSKFMSGHKKNLKPERPVHCIVGYDYVEEKCKDIKCSFKELCKRINKRLKEKF